jgi:hypothetical protein
MLGAAEDNHIPWKGGRAVDPGDQYNGELPAPCWIIGKCKVSCLLKRRAI